MKKEIAEKWVAALRSGEYQQTTDGLRFKDGFCCLGVLCDIVKDDVNGRWDETCDNSFFIITAKNSNSVNELTNDILPETVMSFAGLTSRNPKVKSICLESSDKIRLTELTDVNDGDPDASIKPHSFEEIADIIEKEWETL